MLLAFAFVFSQTAWAGQNQQAKSRADSPQRAAAQQTGEKQSPTATNAKVRGNQSQGEESESSAAGEKLANDGSHQGIKVHGHWTIEVRNPDGSLATHREFENSLATPQFAVYFFLSRTYPVGLWTVELDAGPAGHVCLNSGTAGCFISEPLLASMPGMFPGAFGTLAISSSGTNLVLTGTATANNTGSVGFVRTWVNACPPTTPPNSYSCSSVIGYEFTIASVSPAIPVSAGQTVAVTVNISFS
jgi:hypothetical protein